MRSRNSVRMMKHIEEGSWEPTQTAATSFSRYSKLADTRAGRLSQRVMPTAGKKESGGFRNCYRSVKTSWLSSLCEKDDKEKQENGHEFGEVILFSSVGDFRFQTWSLLLDFSKGQENKVYSKITGCKHFLIYPRNLLTTISPIIKQICTLSLSQWNEESSWLKTC